VMTGEDSMSDDVFEVEDEGKAASAGLTPGTTEQPLTTTPSPTGYRDYKPPAEVFAENYGYSTTTASRDYDNVRSGLKRSKEEDSGMAHKTILLGDSGVGKTSLLVQFDTGRFQHGNFAATVGIGFTGRRTRRYSAKYGAEFYGDDNKRLMEEEGLMPRLSEECAASMWAQRETHVSRKLEPFALGDNLKCPDKANPGHRM
ncbi:Ras-related protein Rab-26, partial [Dufourea novaeangliae]